MSQGEIDKAYAEARAVANKISGHARTATTVLVRGAELNVIRRLLSASLPGGEVDYWRLVKEDLES